jgi:hypothetical protein
VLDFVKSWVNPFLGESKVLDTEEWFQEGHRIVGGKKDARGVWILNHALLFVGISLPLLTRDPWSLQRTPLLVKLERQLHQVLHSGEESGGDILCQLLQTLRQLASVPEDVARWMLQMSGPRQVLSEDNPR